MLLLTAYVEPIALQNLIGLYASRCIQCFGSFVTFKNECVQCSSSRVDEKALVLDNKSLWHKTCEPTQAELEAEPFDMETNCFNLGHTRRVVEATVKENQQVVVCLAPCRRCKRHLTSNVNLMFDDLTGTRWHFLTYKQTLIALNQKQKIQGGRLDICFNSKGFAQVQINIQPILVAGEYLITFFCTTDCDVCFGYCELCPKGVKHDFQFSRQNKMGTIYQGVHKLKRQQLRLHFLCMLVSTQTLLAKRFRPFMILK